MCYCMFSNLNYDNSKSIKMLLRILELIFHETVSMRTEKKITKVSAREADLEKEVTKYFQK